MLFTWDVIIGCWVVFSIIDGDCVWFEGRLVVLSSVILSDDWTMSSSNCFTSSYDWFNFSSEDFSPTRLFQVISSSFVIVSWFIVDWLLSDLSSTLRTVIGLVRLLSEEKISWFIGSFSIIFWFKLNITLLIVSLIKFWIVSIRSLFASSVLCETESWISSLVICSDSDSVVRIGFSLSEICI